jgi:hypothetical protein
MPAAAAMVNAHAIHQAATQGSSPAPGGGFSPAQVRHAYGFDQITFNNGTIQGDGTGQTIAIVDAYDSPNVASDLATFDAAFGLPAPSFTKVNQSGGTNYPAGADSNWSLEIGLDVEWAHAIAPGAKILLVEANSNQWSDLFAAIDYARNYAGVCTVSMSFGVSEWSGETSYDSHFTTPTGHNGVTFTACTGDSGSSGAPWYPSAVPAVLATGGTQLTIDASDNYVSEVGWSGSGGGISAYESQPSYQKGVVTQSSTKRTVPDVASDCSPNSPLGAYVTGGGWGGWIYCYGTSAAAPQWAGLIAIADQGLALAGKGSLDGASQAIPQIYKLNSGDFHDITSGSNGGYSAGSGYDLVTGRGTPVANLVVNDLVAAFAPSGSGQPPTVATPAAASASVVTGNTTNLSVLGSDVNGESTLKYSWTVTSAPSGAPAPTYSANGTNAAKNTTATFYQAGNYTFQVTITDAANLTVTSGVAVTVSQTLTGTTVTPGTATLPDNSSKQFAATAVDQFGKAMTTQPTFTWTLTSGIGSMNASGLYTAPTSGSGTASVQATANSMPGSATVTVTAVPAAPSNLTATSPSSTKVVLTWQNNANNATGIVIQRSTNNSSWTKLTQVSGTATTYTDTTVSKRKTYYYRVYALNGSGNSAYSNTANVVTPSAGVTAQAGVAVGAGATPAVNSGSSSGQSGSGNSPSSTGALIGGRGSSGVNWDLVWSSWTDQSSGDSFDQELNGLPNWFKRRR